MAIHFHSGMPLLWQKASFSPSLPASTSPLLGRAKSSFSAPLKYQCSPSRVKCAAGSKESAVDSLKISAKYDEKELPPLLASLAITGLPPCRESKYADEALARILKLGPANLLEPYYHTCTSFISFLHVGAVSVDRLATISGVCTLVTILDDVLFDVQDGPLLEKLGIDPSIIGSPERIKDYFLSLDALFRQEDPPQNPNQIEAMLWKLGCDVREMSNPEWFKLYADSILDFYNSNYETYCADLVGDRANITDLESYKQMRVRTGAGPISTFCLEFSHNLFLPIEMREHPVIQKLTIATWAYKAFVNDIISYSKEEIYEPNNTNNLVKLFMETEGMSLPQAAWKAVNLANSVVQDFMELETQLPGWEEEPWTSDVRRYAAGLKGLMSGCLYWHILQKRYRHPEAAFPELRDDNVSFNPKAMSLVYNPSENN